MNLKDRLQVAEELIELVLPKCSMKIWEEKNEDNYILVTECTKFATNKIPDYESTFGDDPMCDEHRDWVDPIWDNPETQEDEIEYKGLLERWKRDRIDYVWVDKLRTWQQLHYLNLEELDK